MFIFVFVLLIATQITTSTDNWFKYKAIVLVPFSCHNLDFNVGNVIQVLNKGTAVDDVWLTNVTDDLVCKLSNKVIAPLTESVERFSQAIDNFQVEHNSDLASIDRVMHVLNHMYHFTTSKSMYDLVQLGD